METNWTFTKDKLPDLVWEDGENIADYSDDVFFVDTDGEGYVGYYYSGDRDYWIGGDSIDNYEFAPNQVVAWCKIPYFDKYEN